ncbi:hypothetical protein D3C79_681690 [compost metagenome]
MFHFHRLQHHQRSPCFHRLARLHQYPHDAAIHGRAQPALMAVAGFGLSDRVKGLDGMHFTIPAQV